MDDPVGEYGSAVEGLEVAYKAGLRAFAKWFATEWQLTREEWVKAYAEPPPSDEWFRGHNAGVEAVLMGCDHFLGDFHP